MARATSKLDVQAVKHLRMLRAQGKLNVQEAAMLYGVARETIRRAVRGETWTDLPTTQEEDQAAKESLARMLAFVEAEKAKPAKTEAMLDELQAEPAPAAADPYPWLKRGSK